MYFVCVTLSVGLIGEIGVGGGSESSSMLLLFGFGLQERDTVYSFIFLKNFGAWGLCMEKDHKKC